MKKMLPNDQLYTLAAAGLTNAMIEGGQAIRAGTCAGFPQPLWFAQNALVSKDANGPCDLRLKFPIIYDSRGGYGHLHPMPRSPTRSGPWSSNPLVIAQIHHVCTGS